MVCFWFLLLMFTPNTFWSNKYFFETWTMLLFQRKQIIKGQEMIIASHAFFRQNFSVVQLKLLQPSVDKQHSSKNVHIKKSVSLSKRKIIIHRILWHIACTMKESICYFPDQTFYIAVSINNDSVVTFRSRIKK